jgi:5-oxoprolinase (ATP-hydrolysing) subunit A
MATEGTVVAIDGSVVETRPRSICVHSDTPGALSLAKSVRSALVAAGVRVESFR